MSYKINSRESKSNSSTPHYQSHKMLSSKNAYHSSPKVFFLQRKRTEMKHGYSSEDHSTNENINSNNNNLLSLQNPGRSPLKIGISKSASHYGTKENSNDSNDQLHTYSIRDSTPPSTDNISNSAPAYQQSVQSQSSRNKKNSSYSPNRKATAHRTVIVPHHSSNIHEPHYYRRATNNSRNSNRSHPLNKKNSIRNFGKKRMHKKNKKRNSAIISPLLTPTITPTLSPTNMKSNQFVGDIVMHNSSWEALIQQKEQSSAIHGWRNVFAVLEQQSLRFWEAGSHSSEDAQITIYLNEIIGISKSIRSIDGEKYIVEVNVCNCKCLVAFSNIEQREFWHRHLSDYHLNYFVWRSTPLDNKKRRSKNVVYGVHKLLTQQILSNDESYGVLYIEDVLLKLSILPANIILLVPKHCRFMGGRLQRVLYSIRYFLMSVLKSLSGTNIPLPSNASLIEYIQEVERVKWMDVTPELLDYLTDKCYRVLFNLSFAFTSACRDEVMRKHEIISMNDENILISNEMYTDEERSLKIQHRNDEKIIGELRFEYISLQRSWKMHRSRLQEYVMAYRDSVAKLKHSYHQRDNLCKKIDHIQGEKNLLEKENGILSQQLYGAIEQAKHMSKQISVISSSIDSHFSIYATANPRHLHVQSVPIQYAQIPISNQNTININSELQRVPTLNMARSGSGINDRPQSKKSVSGGSNGSQLGTVSLHLQTLSLDLIRMKAERDTLNIVNARDPNITQIEGDIQNIEQEINSINDSYFNFSPPMSPPPRSPSYAAMMGRSNQNGSGQGIGNEGVEKFYSQNESHVRQMSQKLIQIEQEMNQFVESMEKQNQIQNQGRGQQQRNGWI